MKTPFPAGVHKIFWFSTQGKPIAPALLCACKIAASSSTSPLTAAHTPTPPRACRMANLHNALCLIALLFAAGESAACVLGCRLALRVGGRWVEGRRTLPLAPPPSPLLPSPLTGCGVRCTLSSSVRELGCLHVRVEPVWARACYEYKPSGIFASCSLPFFPAPCASACQRALAGAESGGGDGEGAGGGACIVPCRRGEKLAGTWKKEGTLAHVLTWPSFPVPAPGRQAPAGIQGMED